MPIPTVSLRTEHARLTSTRFRVESGVEDARRELLGLRGERVCVLALHSPRRLTPV
jgi:hypothetical protein